jgi:DNA polymerase III alpha subunit
MSVDKLLEEVRDDPRIWNLYAKGYTMGLNQVERNKTTERVMRYKPRNVVELAAFVAAVRPGFKSMLDTFVNRRHFEYHIPSLDKLLTTQEIPSSFLMYDEQILRILQSAGIPPADAYVAVKAIKKKKADKVKSFRDRFESGFTKMLKEQEGATDEEAASTVDKIWTIINDAASYMF